MNAAQVGITISATRRAFYHSRIQVADARTVDAGSVGQLEAIGEVELVTQAGAGHKVIQMSLIGILLAVRIGSAQETVLIA